MSIEPERPIEKALRAFAKKRREEAGAPPELHPATRRLLQGEVSRRFGKGAREQRSFAQVLAGIWPKARWALAVSALLGILAAILVPALTERTNKVTLAKNDGRMLGQMEDSLHDSPGSAPEAAPTALNSPARDLQLADRRSATAEQEKEALLKREQPQPDTSPILTLEQPPAGEKITTLAAVPRDAFKTREEAKASSSGPLLDRAPSAPDSAASARGYGLAGGLANGHERTAGSAQQQVIGGELAANSAANSRLSLDSYSAGAAGTASASAAGKPLATDELLKLPSEQVDRLALATKGLPTAAAPGAPALAPSPGENRFGYFADDSKKDKDVAIVQRFTQVAPAIKAKTGFSGRPSPAQGLLVSFQVQQNGRELRIVDKDGSVYSGYVQAAEALRRLRSTQPEKPAPTKSYKSAESQVQQKAASAEVDKPALQNFDFRVAGTNRSLKENVIFTGTLFAAANTNLIPGAAKSLVSQGGGAVGGGVLRGQSSAVEPGALPALQLLNSRISGKALIGQRKEVEINAVPVAQ